MTWVSDHSTRKWQIWDLNFGLWLQSSKSSSSLLMRLGLSQYYFIVALALNHFSVYTEIPWNRFVQLPFLPESVEPVKLIGCDTRLPECVIISYIEWEAQMTVNSTCRQKSLCCCNWRMSQECNINPNASVVYQRIVLCGNAGQSNLWAFLVTSHN